MTISTNTNSLGTVIPTKYAWSVGYEPNGNVGSAYDSVNGNWAYLYDNLNRLVGAGSSQGSALAWDYDSFGNMLTQTVTGGYGMGHQAFYNANNQVLDTCYDAAGNQLKDYGCSSPSEYTYDAESRLSSAFFGQTNGAQYTWADGQSTVWTGAGIRCEACGARNGAGGGCGDVAGVIRRNIFRQHEACECAGRGVGTAGFRA